MWAPLKNAPILVLDEATSSLDAESEDAVQTGLRALMRGRTTFIIAHHVSTVTNADRIIALNDRRILESGSQHELIAQAGYYASFVHRQQRGLIHNVG